MKKMSAGKVYDLEYKIQAVKLANEIDQAKAATALGIPKSTVYTWISMVCLGQLDLGEGMHTPKSAITLNEELIQLRQQVKVQEKEIRRLKKENDFLEEASSFFRSEPSELSKNERMKFIAIKTADGSITGNISFYCKMLHVTRQGFYKYLVNRDHPWKYQNLAAAMLDIHSVTPLRKCVTDITEIKASDDKLYASAIFDCFSQIYRDSIVKYNVIQSMNSDGGLCHDNARCESMWARMKSELFYGRYDTLKLTEDELKIKIWRYLIMSQVLKKWLRKYQSLSLLKAG